MKLGNNRKMLSNWNKMNFFLRNYFKTSLSILVSSVPSMNCLPRRQESPFKTLSDPFHSNTDMSRCWKNQHSWEPRTPLSQSSEDPTKVPSPVSLKTNLKHNSSHFLYVSTTETVNKLSSGECIIFQLLLLSVLDYCWSAKGVIWNESTSSL